MPKDTWYDAMDEPIRMLDEFIETAADAIASHFNWSSSSSGSSGSHDDDDSEGGGYFCNVPSHRD